MTLKKFKWHPPAEPPDEAWDGVKKIAGKIARQANTNTTAPIGITYNDIGSGRNRVIRLGPRGAAAIAVEFGTAVLQARRPVKRAIDKMRET